MALPPSPAAAPPAEEMPVDPAMAGADMAAAEEGMDEEPVVVLTVLKNADGSFVLETGDAEGDAAMLVEGAPPAAGGAAPAPAPAGQNFGADEAGVGALMTAILDVIDPENPESPAAQANFAEGFAGPAGAEPPAPPMG